MELNWSTFLLEILNFLILVWILKRFLYQPVLEVIARRRERIERTLQEAKSQKEDAEALQLEYENRLGVWEQERQAALRRLDKEIETERARQLTALNATLEKEREKASVVATRQREAELREMEETALRQGAQFAARLLSLTAGPELQTRLLDLLTKELAGSASERLAGLHTAGKTTPDPIRVTSAYALNETERHALEQSLRTLTPPSAFHYEQDPALLAGVRIRAGAWVLGANLQDELAAFADFANEG
jgi:F-type H+-transporting ATPase subunit b